MITVGSLFSGIGGLELGLERAGMQTVWQVEKDDYCRRVLAKHWPNVTRFDDVHTVGAHNLSPVDLICGGFPCQDISLAGDGAGIAEGTRSGLWFEYRRIIDELRPRYILVENVAALLARGMDVVLGDLAACGYDAEWDCIPAAAVGAPHRRDRVFIVAYPSGERREGQLAESGRISERISGDTSGHGEIRHMADSARDRRESWRPCDATQGARGRQPDRGSKCSNVADSAWDMLAEQEESGTERQRIGKGGRSIVDGAGWWITEPDVGRVAHGIPRRMDRLRGLGNAVVPAVAEFIGGLIVGHARKTWIEPCDSRPTDTSRRQESTGASVDYGEAPRAEVAAQ